MPRRKYDNVGTGRWPVPRHTIEQILIWADAHYKRVYKWPTHHSGRVRGAPGERWKNIDRCLKRGHRGLPGGFTLAELLIERRQARTRTNLPRLSKKQITAWALAHYHRTRTWPTKLCGPIHNAPGETWSCVDSALRNARRGIRAPTSLAQVLTVYQQRFMR